MNIHNMTKEQLAEESLINITFQILTERREPLTLQQMIDEIRELTGASEKEMKERILQYYTDLNIDGRFLAVQDNRWGLREWYPVDQIEEETAPVVKVRKKKKKKSDYDEEEEVEEEEDEDEIFDEEYVELGEEDEEEEDDEEEEVLEIDEDLIEADDDLEVIPDEELELDEEDEEEEYDEEYEEEK